MFDKHLYEQCKKITAWSLRNVPCFYTGTQKDLILTTLEPMGMFIKRGQYEMAKAIKDAVIEYMNEYLPEKDRIPLNAIINEKYFKNIK